MSERKLSSSAAELAKEYTDNYITMNNRPVHRPDVLEAAYVAGYYVGRGESSSELLLIAEDMINKRDEKIRTLINGFQKLRDTIEFAPFFGADATNCVQDADLILKSMIGGKDESVKS